MEAWEKLKWIEILLWIGLYQCLIVTPVILLKKGGNRLANYLLAGFLVVMGLRIMVTLVMQIGMPLWMSSIPRMGFAFLFLYGPFYYFYLKSYIELDFQFRQAHLWHLLPFLLIIVLSVIDFIWIGADAEFIQTQLRDQPPPLPFRLISLCFIIHLSVYIVLGVRRVMFFRRYIKNSADEEEKGKVGWLAFLAWVLLLPIFSVMLTLIIYGPPRGIPYPAVGVALLVSIITIAALIKPEILMGLQEILKVEEDEDIRPSRYESSSLEVAQKNRIHRQLQKVMEEEKLYLDSNLTLGRLSDRLGVNSKYVSQVINEVQEQNFMDYINQKRIKRAEEMLLSPAFAQYTILAIAQEVGFHSKSTFYTAFKKFTGTTPTAFRKAQSVQIQESERPDSGI
ncbi:MAG: helix-turn-helix domain-containing protein [Bacteroidota bacterium]